MSGIPLDFLSLLGILFLVALVLVLVLVVRKQRRIKRLMNPRKDYLKINKSGK